MNIDYIRAKAQELRLYPDQRDILLIRIGRCANLLSMEEASRFTSGKLPPSHRTKIESWLRQNANQLKLTHSPIAKLSSAAK